MDEIEIRTAPEDLKENSKRPAAALLFLFAGVLGGLLFLRSVEGVYFSGVVVYPMMAVVCWLTWHAYFGGIKRFLLFELTLTVIGAAVIFLTWDSLIMQMAYLMDCLFGRNDFETLPVTELAVFLGFLFSFIIAIFEFVLRSHALLSILTMCALLLSPFLGIQAGMGEVILLALFLIAFWVYQTAGTARRKVKFRGIKKDHLSGKSSVVTALVLIVIFLGALPVVLTREEAFYDLVYRAEGQARRAVNSLANHSEQSAAGGRVGNGNNYQVDRENLELTASTWPTENIYLHCFQGGEYLNGNWSKADDDRLIYHIKDKLNLKAAVSLRDAYDSMYYELYTKEEPIYIENGVVTEEAAAIRELEVRSLNDKLLYIPYYSICLSDDGEDGCIYSYHEQNEMEKPGWEQMLSDKWYQSVQTAFMEEIKTAYTQVPKESLPRLSALCQKYPLDSLNEITAFIIYTLHHNAEYTLTPGNAPVNEDIVEYFLFESGRGYCQHFAATATLMYRLYGIPARYVTGYTASPSDFKHQRDGTCKAVVKGNGHAWVEIFLEDYGWTPVDVTPASDGSSIAAYPGFNQEVYEQIVEAHKWDKENPIRLSSDSGNEGAVRQKERFSIENRINKKKLAKFYNILGVCVVYSILLLPLFIDYNRLRRLKRTERLGCREVFLKLLQMLEFGGILSGYDGLEEGFARSLSQQMTSVSQEEIEKMQAIVSKAAYGPLMPDSEQEEYVRRMYVRISDAVYEKLKWHKKLIFRFWKAYK